MAGSSHTGSRLHERKSINRQEAKRRDSVCAVNGSGVVPIGQPHNGQILEGGPSGARTSVPAHPILKRFHCGHFHDCERSFDTFAKLLRHEWIPFAKTTPKGPSIDVLRELCTHERRHKPHDDRPYVCDHCRAKFKYLSLVHRHQAGHSTSRFTNGKSTDANQNRQREAKCNQRIALDALGGELDHVLPRRKNASNLDNDVTSDPETSDCECDSPRTVEAASVSRELALGELAFVRRV